MPTCVVCDSTKWLRLPDPCEGRSVTTAGVIMEESLGKSQCARCGFIVRTENRFVGQTKFYEENYISYYQRPGALVHDRHRYQVMAEWMKRSVPDLNPKRILDVGCGAGWSMAEVTALYPDAIVEGVEPSHSNSKAAIDAGYVVHVGKVTSEIRLPHKYDLIYAKNVLTHVVDIVDFLKGIAGLLTPTGRVVILTVDSRTPSNEFLWCDHNFSFLPNHIKDLAEKAGLVFHGYERNPDDVTILDKQIVVLGLDKSPSPQSLTTSVDGYNADKSQSLFAERSHYVELWKALRIDLDERTRGYKRIFNFGASMWTFLLAGNCPEYWNRIDSCLVDGAEGQCVGKPVVPFSTIKFTKDDVVVLGTNPRTQGNFTKKFENLDCTVLTWGQDISH